MSESTGSGAAEIVARLIDRLGVAADPETAGLLEQLAASVGGAVPVRRWVIQLPGSAGLYADPDYDDPDVPMLFRQRGDAQAEADQLAAQALDLGIYGWAAEVCTFAEAGATAPLPRQPVLPAAAAIERAYPAATDAVESIWAIALPGDVLYRDAEAVANGQPFTTYYSPQAAADTARQLRHHAARLGNPGHRVAIVTRTTTTSTGPWAPVR